MLLPKVGFPSSVGVPALLCVAQLVLGITSPAFQVYSSIFRLEKLSLGTVPKDRYGTPQNRPLLAPWCLRISRKAC